MLGVEKCCYGDTETRDRQEAYRKGQVPFSSSSLVVYSKPPLLAEPNMELVGKTKMWFAEL